MSPPGNLAVTLTGCNGQEPGGSMLISGHLPAVPVSLILSRKSLGKTFKETLDGRSSGVRFKVNLGNYMDPRIPAWEAIQMVSSSYPRFKLRCGASLFLPL